VEIKESAGASSVKDAVACIAQELARRVEESVPPVLPAVLPPPPPAAPRPAGAPRSSGGSSWAWQILLATSSTRILNLRFLSHMPSHDVASIKCLALGNGVGGGEGNKKGGGRACANCGCTAHGTPLMRRGPNGVRSLCNACGLWYARRGTMRPVVGGPPPQQQEEDQEDQEDQVGLATRSASRVSSTASRSPDTSPHTADRCWQ